MFNKKNLPLNGDIMTELIKDIIQMAETLNHKKFSNFQYKVYQLLRSRNFTKYI